jgi:hypothetical protein
MERPRHNGRGRAALAKVGESDTARIERARRALTISAWEGMRQSATVDASRPNGLGVPDGVADPCPLPSLGIPRDLTVSKYTLPPPYVAGEYDYAACIATIGIGVQAVTVAWMRHNPGTEVGTYIPDCETGDLEKCRVPNGALSVAAD